MARNAPALGNPNVWFSCLSQRLEALGTRLAGQDGRDLVQATLLKAWKAHDKVMAARNPFRYVVGIMRNLHYDSCRKKGVACEHFLDGLDVEERLNCEHDTLLDVGVNWNIFYNMAGKIKKPALQQMFLRQLHGPTTCFNGESSCSSDREMEEIGQDLRHWMLKSYTPKLQELLMRFLCSDNVEIKMFSRLPPGFFVIDDPGLHGRAHAWLLDRQNSPDGRDCSVMCEVLNYVARCVTHNYAAAVRQGRRIQVSCVFVGNAQDLHSRKGPYAYLTPTDVAGLHDQVRRTTENGNRWLTIPPCVGLDYHCQPYDTLALMTGANTKPLLFRRCRYTYATDWVRPSQDKLRLLESVLRASEPQDFRSWTG